MKTLFLLLPIGAGFLLWNYYSKRSEAPELAFAKVKRETLVSVLSTNGKVEPVEWRPVRVEVSGSVERIFVEQGRRVRKGSALLELKSSGLQADLAAAERRIEAARAELSLIERGGRSSDLAEIENGLARARLSRETAEREIATLRRLQEKQAATGFEVSTADDRLRQAEAEMEAWQRKKGALAAEGNRKAAEAALRDGQAAKDLALERIAQLTLRAPMDGVAYGVDARTGSWLNAGDLVANVGRFEKLRVRVYVDEPELGRVSHGQPITIAWDADPLRTWTGSVERLASEIVPLGSRQVGEVLCSIANSEGRLVPGTNVNVEIRTAVAPDALTIPREALRREPAQGCWVLVDGQLRWRKVTAGASSVTRVQAVDGLNEGDSVALPSGRVLKDGDRVKAVYP